MMKAFLFFSLSATLVFLAGCQTQPGPYMAKDSTKYTVESTDKFVLLDKYSQNSVTCTGLLERSTPENLLEIAANVKNRDSHPIRVQINCAFESEQSTAPAEETPWQTIDLAENATETVRFTSPDAQALKYTLRVRQSR